MAHSRDLGSAVMLLGSLGILAMAGGTLVASLGQLLQAHLGGQAWRTWLGSPHAGQLAASQWNDLVSGLSGALLPILAGALALALLAHLVQTGFLFRPARLVPDASRINPLTGLERMFSTASLLQWALDAGKVLVVASVGFAGLWFRREELAGLTACDPATLAARFGSLAWRACLEMGGALAALALVDYLYQRWKLERELKMTSQELRDEMRELSGNPQIAARRRAQRRGA